ncbi:MAG: lipopolysaccharide biosynthesis protein [Eubacteriales bacterium]|nr:lipopolysaccharide biosynthesis protein [Eubacteriales bacterium]
MQTSRKDFVWNMAGSIVYAFSSMLLSFFVMNVLGASDGGIFGFGFSTYGQQLFIIAYFGIRPMQITDVKGEYTFGDYKRLRMITSLFAVLGGFVHLGFLFLNGNYSLNKAAIIWLLAIYKIIDGYADVYESEAQRAGRLWVGGRSLMFRTIWAMSGIMLGVLLTRELIIAALLGVCFQLLYFFIFEKRDFKNYVIRGNEISVDKACSAARINALFNSAFLLFISVFLDFFVFSAAKYSIDRLMTDADSGIFNILFMPTNIIYLVANFVIKPYMTKLAFAFEKHDLMQFKAVYNKLQYIIIGLIVFSLAGVMLLGRPVLYILELILGSSYAGMLTRYKSAFFWIIAGGGIYALANLYYYILVIIRQQKNIFFVYLAATVAAILQGGLLVKACGINGAAYTYLGLMFVLLSGFVYISRREIKKTFLNKIKEEL